MVTSSTVGSLFRTGPGSARGLVPSQLEGVRERRPGEEHTGHQEPPPQIRARVQPCQCLVLALGSPEDQGEPDEQQQSGQPNGYPQVVDPRRPLDCGALA